MTGSDDVLSVRQAALILGVSESGVGRLIDSGVLGCYRPTPRRRVLSRAEVICYRDGSYTKGSTIRGAVLPVQSSKPAGVASRNSYSERLDALLKELT